MLVRDAPELEVFMLRRNLESVFVGGAYVFPGGAVDADDRAPEPSLAAMTATTPTPALRSASRRRARLLGRRRAGGVRGGGRAARPVGDHRMPVDLDDASRGPARGRRAGPSAAAIAAFLDVVLDADVDPRRGCAPSVLRTGSRRRRRPAGTTRGSSSPPRPTATPTSTTTTRPSRRSGSARRRARPRPSGARSS